MSADVTTAPAKAPAKEPKPVQKTSSGSGGSSAITSSLAGLGYAEQTARLSPGSGSGGGLASLGLGGLPVQLKANGLTTGPSSASEVAASAFSGTPSEVPGRAAQEASFGQSFGAVQAYTGPAASAACDSLGAEAMAVGNKVAFKDSQPSAPTVAHELTHVLESGGGVRAKDGDASKVDTSHEGTAEAVEAHVRSGGNASEVIAEQGLGPGGDGIQMLQSRFSMSGLMPGQSFGGTSAGGMTISNTEIPLWPRTIISSPPIYILPPPIYFQIVTSAALQTHGTLPVTDPQWNTQLGGRIRGDFNLEIAGGVPEVMSLSGGAGLRLDIGAGVQANQETWRIYGGDVVLTGALIVALNAGPQGAIRLEFRAVEAEILRGNLVEITPNGIDGWTMGWGRDIEYFASFLEEVAEIGRRIGNAVTAPIRRVVVRAGETAMQALEGVAEIADVLSCLGGGIGLGIGQALSGPTYNALWDEALAIAMLRSGGAQAQGANEDQDWAIDSILGTLYSEFVEGREYRREIGDVLELLAWHQRVQSTMVESLADVDASLGTLGASHLGSMSLIEFMWAFERNGFVRFAGDPNDLADRHHGPLIAQAQEGMAQAEADHAAQCGGE